jgi:rare lipoprotein A
MHSQLRAALPAAVVAFAVSFGIPSPAALASNAKSSWDGTASYYGPGFHGRRTANGERFDMNGLTAAHRSLPFGTRVKVTNVKNGRSVVVRVNDRGPFLRNRIIDLSRGAAAKLGMVDDGLARVRLERQK